MVGGSVDWLGGWLVHWSVGWKRLHCRLVMHTHKRTDAHPITFCRTAPTADSTAPRIEVLEQARKGRSRLIWLATTWGTDEMDEMSDLMIWVHPHEANRSHLKVACVVLRKTPLSALQPAPSQPAPAASNRPGAAAAPPPW